MGRDPEPPPEEPPATDSEGVYHISVEEFESRLPRTNPPPNPSSSASSKPEEA